MGLAWEVTPTHPLTAGIFFAYAKWRYHYGTNRIHLVAGEQRKQELCIKNLSPRPSSVESHDVSLILSIPQLLKTKAIPWLDFPRTGAHPARMDCLLVCCSQRYIWQLANRPKTAGKHIVSGSVAIYKLTKFLFSSLLSAVPNGHQSIAQQAHTSRSDLSLQSLLSSHRPRGG